MHFELKLLFALRFANCTLCALCTKNELHIFVFFVLNVYFITLNLYFAQNVPDFALEEYFA